jgi:hypothetical protein
MELRQFDVRYDLEEVLRLFSMSLINSGDEKWFRWKHTENPCGPSFGYVALKKEKIVGVKFLMQWNLVVGNRMVKALRPVDTVTHPDHRGNGVFNDLTLYALSVLNSKGYDLMFNTPNRESLHGNLKMGWVKLQSPIPHFFFLINQFVTRKRICLHHNFDRLVFPFYSSDFLETDKTKEFFSWRYSNDRYKIVTFEGDFTTFLVYRISYLKGIPVLVIVDYLGDAGCFSHLVSSISKELNIFIGHCMEFSSVFSAKGLTKIQRGNSVVVYNGPKEFIHEKWKFSPGDLEGII